MMGWLENIGILLKNLYSSDPRFESRMSVHSYLIPGGSLGLARN
jgi:hypothetical protein